MRWLAAVLLVGCGGASGGAFGPTYPDNVDADVGAVLARLRASSPASEQALAAGLSGDSLFVVNLETSTTLWRKPVQSPVSAPAIAGGLVILHEQAGLVARDLSSGATRFTLEDDALHFAGADGEGDATIISLTTGGGVGARSKLVFAQGGSIAWTREVDQAVGAPALAGGMIFVPWATQNVSILDATGAEIARVRATDTAVARAFHDGGEVYFGQRGIFRLTPRMTVGTREGNAYVEPLARDLPGNPALMVDPYRPAPAPSSALHRVRYAWHPVAAGDSVAFADDNLYAIFYRIVFALSPSADEIRWVYEHDHDIVGAAAQPGGLLVADDNGGFAHILADSGRAHWRHQEEGATSVVTLRANRFSPSGAAAGDVPVLRDQLLSAAQNTDARLVPARVMAVHALRDMPDPEVTEHLINLCDDARVPETVRTESCAGLRTRTTGAEYISAALQRHARFLEGTTAPPVGALAQAAVAMRATATVPLLLAHLRDPETAEADLVSLIESLAALEDRTAVEPLTDFVRLYHAEATTEGMQNAVDAAAKALIALQGPAAEEALTAAANDPLAPDVMRGRLNDALATLEEPEATDTSGEEGEPSEEGETDAEVEADDRPDRIDARVVSAVLEPVREDLQRCIQQANVRSARVVLRLAGDGALEGVSVAPAPASTCIEGVIRAVRFPANRQNVREQVTYTVR
ncbi:MAG: hypothetical protein AAGE52_09775 [Myxococcota bacterium]